MAKLTDIADLGVMAKVGETSIAVKGVSLRGVISLVTRFKADLAKLDVSGGISAASLLTLGPAVVAAIIAAGCGQPGNAEAEAVADDLGVAAQIEILDAVLAGTIPDGLDPFVARIAALAKRLDPEMGKEIETAYSEFKAAKLLQLQSTSSSAPDTAAKTSGG